MKIAIIHGEIPPDAPPDEQDVLVEAAAIRQALAATGHQVIDGTVSLDLTATQRFVDDTRPDLIFNLVESVAGKGRLIHLAPALFDVLGIAYTGAHTEALFLTSNKLLAKQWLAVHGIATPAWATFGQVLQADPAFAGPYIIKSVWEHASIGLDDDSVVADANQLSAALERKQATLGSELFVEAFVEGREFNVGLLAGPQGPQTLPIAEMCFPDFEPGRPKMVGYQAKWHEDSYEYQHTVRRFDIPAADGDLLGRLAAIAQQCWHDLGLRGYARVDFRVDAGGRPWVLEINVNPCIAPDSGFVAALRQAGLDYPTAVQRIVADSAHSQTWSGGGPCPAPAPVPLFRA